MSNNDVVDCIAVNSKDSHEVREICHSVINLQEKMKSSFFWTPPYHASVRRSAEKYNSQHFDFVYGGHKYIFEQDTKYSCRNVYFSSGFYIDGKKKDVRIVKKLLAQVEKDLLNNVEVNDYEK